MRRLPILVVLIGVIATISAVAARRASSPPTTDPGGRIWPPLPAPRQADADSAPTTPVPDTDTDNDTIAPSVTWVEPVDGACPVSHPIKANIRSGIYHEPGTTFYRRTVPHRCYATTAAAEADGLRRPRRGAADQRTAPDGAEPRTENER